MNKIRRIPKLQGDQRDSYLLTLDDSLQSLRDGLAQTQERKEVLATFGEKNHWRWNRLPPEDRTHEELASMVERVRKEYQWLHWITIDDQPDLNQGYFQEVHVSPISGLPNTTQVVRVHQLQGRAHYHLSSLPSHEQNADTLYDLLTSDKYSPQEVIKISKELHENSMKRNYLERLQQTKLIGWRTNKSNVSLEAKKELDLGVEERWKLTYTRFSQGTGQYHLYVIDLWQDQRNKQIIEGEDGSVQISERLKSILNFGQKATAWYMLKSLDDQFDSLHPVHVSRGLIGPYDTIYRNKPGQEGMLNVSRRLLQQDLSFSLLRFTRQYAYAPNREEKDQKLRQIIHRQDWTKEFLVCPSHYASDVSAEIAGTDINVFEI